MNPLRPFLRHLATALLGALLLTSIAGCAVGRGQESVGAYVDDAAITAAVKARMMDDKTVDGTSISVETLNGTVMLSGFAKSSRERESAEALALRVSGVKSVKNAVVVRP